MNNENDLFNQETLLLFDIIKQMGGEARLVGGCVRDYVCRNMLNCYTITTDIDVATDLKVERLLAIHGANDQIKCYPTGLKHGTITAVINGKEFQVTTLRRDVICDGRHAITEYTPDWLEDASRRDFTINALYMGCDNTIYDYFNGIEDLRNGIVQFIHDPEARIREDYLRILRYFRFWSRFSQETIIESTLLIIFKRLTDNIQYLSGERILSELIGILQTSRWCITIENMMFLFDQCGISNVNIVICRLLSSVAHDPIDRLNALAYFTPFDQLKNRLKLSRNQCKRLLFLRKRYNNWDHHIITKNDIQKTFLFFNDRVKVLYEVIHQNINNLDGVSYFLPFIELLPESSRDTFPIIAKDIFDLLKDHMNLQIIPQLLQITRSWWAKHNAKPTKNDCIDYIITYLLPKSIVNLK